MQKKTKSLLKIFVSVIVCAVLLVIFMEVYLRQYYVPNNFAEMLAPSDYGTFELKPNLSMVFNGNFCKIPQSTIYTDCKGIRIDNPRNLPGIVFELGDPLVIVGLGDSNMFGWGVDYEESQLYVAGRCLSEKLNRSVKVINLGVPGYDSVDEAKRFEHLGLQFDPDIVIVDYGANDDAPTRSYDEVVGVYKPTAYDNFVRKIPFLTVTSRTIFSSRFILSHLHLSNKYSSSLENHSFDRVATGLGEIIESSKNNNVSVIVNTYWGLGQDENRENLEKFLKENNISLNDMSEIYKMFPDVERKLSGCDGHFTPVVREYIGNRICDFILEVQNG